MGSEDGCRTGGADRTQYRIPYRPGFPDAWHDAAEPASLRKHPQRDRNRLSRNQGQAREAVVVNLLLTTDVVQFDDLREDRIGKIGGWRIVKGDMSVLPYAQADHVDRSLGQQCCIALGLGKRGSCLPVDRVEASRLDVIEKMSAQVCPKTLGMGVRQSHIVIHVKYFDALPKIQPRPRLADERTEKLVLRRSARKYHTAARLRA